MHGRFWSFGYPAGQVCPLSASGQFQPRLINFSKMSQRWKNALLRPRIVYIVLALLFVFALSGVKSSWVSDYSQKKIDFVQANNERIFNLFQASFYFYYEDQFKPGIEDFLAKNP